KAVPKPVSVKLPRVIFIRAIIWGKVSPCKISDHRKLVCLGNEAAKKSWSLKTNLAWQCHPHRHEDGNREREVCSRTPKQNKTHCENSDSNYSIREKRKAWDDPNVPQQRQL